MQFAHNALTRTFVGQPGQGYRFWLFPRDGPPMEQVVFCSQEDLITPVQFHLPSNESLGELEIALHESFPKCFNRDYRVSVRRVGDEHTLFSGEFQRTMTTQRLEAGEYVVLVSDSRVETAQPESIRHNWIADAPMFFHEQVVRIQPGENTRIEVPPATGGRIAVWIRQDPDLQPVEREAIPAIQIFAENEESEVQVRWRGTLQKERPPGKKLDVRQLTLDTLPKGRYRLVVTCPGFQTVRREFRVEENRLMRLRVTLER